MINNIFDKVSNIVIDAVFPNICVCGKWGTPLCEDCAGKIKLNRRELCPACRRLSEHGKTCPSCRSRSYLTGVLILNKYEGDLKSYIWRYKYEFVKDLSNPLAKMLSAKYEDFIRGKDFLITFVPSSQARMLWRGFNQSELLANELANLLKIECVSLLKKDEIGTQVGLKRAERIKNISNAIMPVKNSKLINKKMLIVDDVYTTGATLEACAKELRRMGAGEVWGMVLARE